jgi:succinate dehydrogenase/fumarate reductase cytochrome b subunit
MTRLNWPVIAALALCLLFWALAYHVIAGVLG